MLISKFRADGTTKKLRITEEFAQLIIKLTGGNLSFNEKVSIYLERAGKNVEICNRISLKKLAEFSSYIEGTVFNEKYPFCLSIFQNGNFKSKENDAVIVEFHDLTQDHEYSVYGLQDIEETTAILLYETKTILHGERTKTFNLEGIQRVEIPIEAFAELSGTKIGIQEVGFIYRDQNGGLVERKYLYDELLFSNLSQQETNSTIASNINLSASARAVLPVDGLSQLKFYFNSPSDRAIDMIFQSAYEVVQTAQPTQTIPNIIGPLSSAVKLGGIGKKINF